MSKNLVARRVRALRMKLTEAGTLQLSAVPRSGEERWKVEFDVRGQQPQ